MTTKTHEIGIGTAVTYEDMANPLRRGTIVGEVAGQWAVKWDGYDGGATLAELDGVEFHTTVTKTMLANAQAKQIAAREERRGRLGGWDAETTIRMGDVVRLANGATVTVDSLFDSYTDAEGEHEGPFISIRGTRDYRRISEVVGIVKRNDRLCTICGEGITSTNPKVDYCRSCHYNGAALERSLRTDDRDLLARIGALDGVEDATVWHTGGGCFNLAITLDDGRLLTPSTAVESGDDIFAEPGIPNLADGERWALVISESEEAWSDWDEDKIAIPHRVFDDDTLVEAVAATIKGEEV